MRKKNHMICLNQMTCHILFNINTESKSTIGTSIRNEVTDISRKCCYIDKIINMNFSDIESLFP